MSARVAVHLLAYHTDFGTVLDACRELDELGADIIFVPDHFFPPYGDTHGKQFEGLTTLTAIAAVTERAELGGLVFCNAYRNPELLVDAHRTVDHIAGGRVILGVGAGWMQKDFEEYGYAYGTVGDRLSGLRRDLPRMTARLARLNPPPLREMPFLIGGSGPNVTLRLVAEHADAWNSFGPPSTFRHKNQVLDEWCADVGRDPAEIERTVAISPDEIGALDAFVDAGAEHVIVMTVQPYDLDPVRRILDT